MAYTAPRTWVAGEVVTASQMNTHVRDNISYLYGIQGANELWVPATRLLDSGSSTPMGARGYFPVAQLYDANDAAYVSWKCPGNFSSITTAVMVLIPQVTQAAADLDIYTQYGAIGEAYTTNAESDTASTYNLTQWQLFGVDFSGVLAALAADDYVACVLWLGNSAHDVDVVGFHMKYVPLTS